MRTTKGALLCSFLFVCTIYGAQSGRNPLYDAIDSNDGNKAQEILSDNSIDVTNTVPNGIPALQYAYLQHNRDSSQELLKVLFASDRLDPNQVSCKEGALIHYAASFGFSGLLNLLITNRKLDINKKNEAGDTALVIALSHMKFRFALKLLEHENIDPYSMNSADKPPLEIIECWKGDGVSVQVYDGSHTTEVGEKLVNLFMRDRDLIRAEVGARLPKDVSDLITQFVTGLKRDDDDKMHFPNCTCNSCKEIG